MWQFPRSIAVLVPLLVAASGPALAQTPLRTPDGKPVPIENAPADIVGSWATLHSEDLWERRSGLEVGDFTGVPLNEAGKLGAASWSPNWFSIPEEQCRPHTGIYAPRGPYDVTIEAEYNQQTQTLVAYQFYGGTIGRTVWMDGRPEPPDWARSTYAGFSTGRWEGDTLVVRTSHIKAGYLQRNGIPHSDRAEALEYWTRQGDTLLLTSFINDPGYLSEPLVKTTNWRLDLEGNAGRARLPNCKPYDVVEETPGMPAHFVPHFLPGHYDQAEEFQKSKGIPPEVAFGGAETLYPEFIPKLHALRGAYMKTLASNRPKLAPGPGQPDFIGYWTLNRGKSKYNVSWSRVDLDARDGSAPERRTITIEPAAEGSFKMTVDTQNVANDTGTHRQEYTAKLDGQDYTTKGGAIESFAFKKIDAHTFQRVGKVKGKTVETATITVSPDTNTLTIAYKGAFEGQTYDNVEVFTRDK